MGVQTNLIGGCLTDPADAVAALRLVAKGEASLNDIVDLADKVSKSKSKRKRRDPAVAAVEDKSFPKDGARERVESAAPGPTAPPHQEQQEAELLHRYFLGYLRLATGRIEGLTTDELWDAAVVCKTPGCSFEEWKARRLV